MSQLYMKRADLENLPPLILPGGYVLREYSQRDEGGVSALLTQTFGDEWTSERTRREFAEREDVEKTFVIAYDEANANETVATATAVIFPADRNTGYVHMVAASPQHAGKRLGFLASLATLHEFARLGCTSAILDTDDFRLPAVKTYLNLGFVPVHRDATHEDRWKIVMADLQKT